MSEVVVHGLGCVEDMVRVLEDIDLQMKASAQRGPQQAENTGAPTPTREFKTEGEFKDLVQRVKSGKAAVNLRKLFLYRGSAFNVMQEVWIQASTILMRRGPTEILSKSLPSCMCTTMRGSGVYRMWMRIRIWTW
jgi:hypothetical protein